MSKSYVLVRPCSNCPFRTDCLEGWLGAARAQEIINSMFAEDKSFHCHETTEFDDEGDAIPHDKERHCGGAAILLHKSEMPNQMMRIAARLGTFDPDALDLSAPVFDTSHDFIQHHAGPGYVEPEPCSVVNAGCEAPAGFMVGGRIAHNIPDEGATHPCESCGEPVCDNCEDDCYCKGGE